MSQEEKSQAMLMWILMLFAGFVSPVIFMLVGKDKPGVYRSSMQALTFEIVFIIVVIAIYAIGFILIFVAHGLGFIMFPLVGIAALFRLYIIIKGAIESNAGNVFEPPITGNLAKQWFKV